MLSSSGKKQQACAKHMMVPTLPLAAFFFLSLLINVRVFLIKRVSFRKQQHASQGIGDSCALKYII